MVNKLLKVIIILSLIELSIGLNCVDENGSPVDWFIVYKVPKLETSSSPLLKSGFGYTFITDKTINSRDWTLSKKPINQKDSIFGQTIGPLISQINKVSNDMSFVVYNDQTPGNQTF
jgi:deoxyribonuclease-2